MVHASDSSGLQRLMFSLHFSIQILVQCYVNDFIQRIITISNDVLIISLS